MAACAPARAEDLGPKRSFDDSKSPELYVQRTEKLETSACSGALQGLMAMKVGEAWDFGSPSAGGPEAWKPWKKKDLEAIEECKESPCGVKVDAAEGRELGALEPTQRFKRYLEIVHARAMAYRETGKRREYEFPGEPPSDAIDPWKAFSEMGLRSEVKLPSGVNFRARIMDFGDSKFREVRQLLDVRSAQVSAKEATVWIRDVVEDHYFDGWGEWRDVRCEAGGTYITLVLALEVDLLKENDLLAKLGRGPLKSGIEKQSQLYLDGIARGIAGGAKPSPSP